MGVRLELLPAVRDAVEEARRHIEGAGFTMSEDAYSELSELVLSGFRLMQASRVLDLSEDSPERQRQEALAKQNLLGLMDAWLNIERARGNRELSLGGFRRSYAKFCPVYPCESK